jgi:hypothetical protein
VIPSAHTARGRCSLDDSALIGLNLVKPQGVSATRERVIWPLGRDHE